MSSKSLFAFFDGRPLSSAELIKAVKASPALAKEVDGATGNTALHFACCSGAPLSVVEALLAAHPAAAAVCDADGNLPIVGAVANGCAADVVRALLERHPDGVRARRGKHTLLHTACACQQSIETVALLLERWPAAAAERDAQAAPLHFAACQAPAAVVAALLESCAAAGWRGEADRYPPPRAPRRGAARRRRRDPRRAPCRAARLRGRRRLPQPRPRPRRAGAGELSAGRRSRAPIQYNRHTTRVVCARADCDASSCGAAEPPRLRSAFAGRGVWPRRSSQPRRSPLAAKPPLAMAAAKPSLAYLADKFNTEAPAGYVPGRGRGIAGFSKPPAEPPKRGKPPPGGAAAAADDDDDERARRRAALSDDDEFGGEEAGDGAATEEGLDGEAGDTRELDLAETQRYEKAGASMDQTEAGYAIEPFNMRAERSEGHFDESFNYVWNRKDDDLHDAWLKETDGATAESDEKVQKRREILRRQRATQDEPAAPAADLPTLRRALVALLQPGESTARALKRLAAPTAARAAPKPRVKKRARDGGSDAGAGACRRRRRPTRRPRRRRRVGRPTLRR